MPQNIGSASIGVNLDLRNASRQYAAFQRQLNSSGKNNLFSSISSDAKDFENSLGKATNRVVAFASAAAVFGTLAKTASSFAQAIVEVDNSLAKINVNLGQSADSLKAFGAQVFNVARQTGQTFEVAAKAAEELARQGLGAEDTIDRLQKALVLSRIAGIDSAEAVETLTAAINSFNQSALTAGEIVNKFAAVDTKFAVSSKDLAEAVSRVGSTAQAAGVGIDQLIGLVTSLQQTTARGGATIGNGLKTIFTRIQSAPETINALESIGVAIKNTDGSLRDAISILRDYAAARDKVGEVERQGLDRTVAGTFQINILKAALADLGKEYSVYGSAVKTASGATDEAIRKNEVLNQTLTSLINSTTVSIKQFFASVGNVNIGPALATALKYFEKARAFFSGDSGSDLGKSLGDGLIKGIGAVISGPALAALVFVVANAFKKVLVTIAQEARTLLTINSAVQARANAQKEINTLLTQANAYERQQLALATSTLQTYEALVAVRARLNQESLAGTPLTNLAVRRGGFAGKVPGFADPIRSAIARESAASGLPTNQVYVDRDSRVATFANPMGILVANRRDEPLGGYQGVNRVLGQGGNPKTNGIPGFAASRRNPFDSDAAETRSVIQSLNEESKNFGTSLKSLNFELKQVVKQLYNTTSASHPFGPQLPVSYGPPRPGSSVRVNTNQSYRSPQADQFDANMAAYSASQGPYQASRGTSPARANKQSDNERYYSNAFYRNQQNSYISDIDPFAESESRTRIAEFRANRNKQKREAQRIAQEAATDAAFTRSQARRSKILTGINQRRQSIQNRTLGASFALPLIGGFAEPAIQGLGFSTKGGTGGGRVAGAITYASSFAGVGALSSNPYVAGGAAGIGALIGFFSKLEKSTEELTAEIDEQIAKRNNESEALSRAVEIQEQLNEARKSGDDPKLIDKLEASFRQARGKLTDEKTRSILNISDPRAQGKAIISDQEDKSRQNAQSKIQQLLLNPDVVNQFQSGKNGNETLVDSFKEALDDSDIAKISDEQILKISKIAAGTNYSVSPNLAYNPTTFSASVTNQNAVDKSAEEFRKDADELASLLKNTTVGRKQITPDKINGLALALLQTVASRKGQINSDADKEKQPIGLARGAFTSSVDSTPLKQAAFAGRNPFAFTQNQRAQSQFGFFNSLVGAGALDEKLLGDNPVYQKSKAISQSDNLNKVVLDFVRQALGSDAGEFTDFKGEAIPSALQGALKGLTKRSGQQGENASVLLDLLDKGQQGKTNAGVKTLPTLLNSLVVGGKYSTYSGGSADSRIKVNPFGLDNDYDKRAKDRASAKQYIDDHTPIGGLRSGFTVTSTPSAHPLPNKTDYADLKDVPETPPAAVTATVNVNVNGSVESTPGTSFIDQIVAAIQSIVTKGLESSNPNDQAVQAILQKLGVSIPKPLVPTVNKQGVPAGTAQ